jgi:hypothetical protein
MGPLLQILKSRTVSVCSRDNDNGLERCPPYEETSLETLISTGCTDGEDLTGLTKAAFSDYYEVLKGHSKWVADIWFRSFAQIRYILSEYRSTSQQAVAMDTKLEA